MVYVDMLIDYGWKLGASCHLLADTEEELHKFASSIGMKRNWFQDGEKHTMPHYDLTAKRRGAAISKGAIEIDRKQLVEKIKTYKQLQKTTIMERLDNIPMLNANDEDFADKLKFELWSTQSSSDIRNDRERPYDGQPWTMLGERGKTEVKGLSMRDIGDCFVRAILGFEETDKTWRYQDVYKMDFSQIDPLALQQNMLCNIEKMMGIYPNIKK